jgi:transposase-like protein
LYSSGLSLRKTCEKDFCDLLRELILPSGIGFKSSTNQSRRYCKKKKKKKKKKKIQEFIVDDETLIKVGNQFAWLLWIAVDSINKLILGIRISFERTILVAELFLNLLVKYYGNHILLLS